MKIEYFNVFLYCKLYVDNKFKYYIINFGFNVILVRIVELKILMDVFFEEMFVKIFSFDIFC